jgi:hypothetical protein
MERVMHSLPERSEGLHIALELAGAGLHVFPVRIWQDGAKLAKQPLVQWRDASTTDPDIIRKWWEQYPDAAIGIDLKASLLVVDLDRHLGGPDGYAAFRELAKQQQQDFSKCPVTCTASDGRHIYFQQPADPLGNGKGNLPAGVDVRGNGGFVVSPGSCWQGWAWRSHPQHPRLVDAYSRKTIPTLPAWLHELIKPPPAPIRVTPTSISDGAGRLRALVRTIASAVEGERNCVLFWATCRANEMVQAGEYQQHFIESVLIEAAGRVGLPRGEALRTIRSGMVAR